MTSQARLGSASLLERGRLARPSGPEAGETPALPELDERLQRKRVTPTLLTPADGSRVIDE